MRGHSIDSRNHGKSSIDSRNHEKAFHTRESQSPSYSALVHGPGFYSFLRPSFFIEQRWRAWNNCTTWVDWQVSFDASSPFPTFQTLKLGKLLKTSLSLSFFFCKLEIRCRDRVRMWAKLLVLHLANHKHSRKCAFSLVSSLAEHRDDRWTTVYWVSIAPWAKTGTGNYYLSLHSFSSCYPHKFLLHASEN